MDVSVEAAWSCDSLVRPCAGQRVSGDTAWVRELEDCLFLAIVDVLGHGEEAHELTPVIEAYLERAAGRHVAGVMNGLHERLRGTRGAAAGLCAIDTARGSLEYVGVGNTAIRRFGSGEGETRLVSLDGVLGQNMRTLRPQTLALEPGDLVLLYTDGVSDRFTSASYPGLAYHEPADVTRRVIERFGKGHDDAACIALRWPG